MKYRWSRGVGSTGSDKFRVVLSPGACTCTGHGCCCSTCCCCGYSNTI